MQPRRLLVRDQSDAHPATESACRIGEVGIPALAPQRLVGRFGPHNRACSHAVFWLGISPMRTQPPNPLAASAKSAYQLSLHSGSSVGSDRTTGHAATPSSG